MEGKNGVNMAIIKDIMSESSGDDAISSGAKKREAVLLRKNYQNLEELIQYLMSEKNVDANYLKLAKLNRLKVLMELSMKMVGRKYNDIGGDERRTLEFEANRFHSTYPLPGEEKPLPDELDETTGTMRPRMAIKIATDDGNAKIDLNAKYLIDPAEFLKIYTSKLVNHAQDSTGLVVKAVSSDLMSMLLLRLERKVRQYYIDDPVSVRSPATRGDQEQSEARGRWGRGEDPDEAGCSSSDPE